MMPVAEEIVMSTTSPIDKEIAAYEKIQGELETKHFGEWVLIHDEQLVNLFENFEDAAKSAVEKFGRGPYLIRQIGAPPAVLPASVLYKRQHA